MATLGEITDKIAKRLIDTSNTAVTRSDIQGAINDSIQYWKSRAFWFNEATANFDFDDGAGGFTPVLTLPDDCLYLLQDSGMTIEYQNIRYKIARVQQSQYDWMNAEFTGIPYAYTIQGARQYVVYPYPDQNYTGTFRYLKDYTDFSTNGSDDNNSNDFTLYAENLIRADALSRLHAELRQDGKMAALFAQRAEAEYANIVRRTSNQNATGRMSLETILTEDY